MAGREKSLSDLIAAKHPSVMLGPDWTEDRWPVPVNARGLTTVDAEGRPLGIGWWVPFGEGWEVPAGFEYVGSEPFEWAMWIQVLDGKAECVALRMMGSRGGPLRSGALRELAPARLLEEAVLLASRPWDEIPKRRVWWESIEEARSQRREVASTFQRQRRNPQDREPISEDLLRAVAKVYRDNLTSKAPTRAVAKELNYSRASAGRLVMKARCAGFLPKTQQGQARG